MAYLVYSLLGDLECLKGIFANDLAAAKILYFIMNRLGVVNSKTGRFSRGKAQAPKKKRGLRASKNWEKFL
ncbi:MAG: hypothetical protein C5B58_02105 [Acidobacteria bacterium]|nr:MAG: hypothetical protein C5B58_02105 [Acidobacteriota bacterium]